MKIKNTRQVEGKRRFEIVIGCDLPGECGEGNADDYNCYLVDTSHSPWRVIAYGGGETEDRNFYRDFSGIADELNSAYRDGFADGVTKRLGAEDE